jgi:hypothetical protein
VSNEGNGSTAIQQLVDQLTTAEACGVLGEAHGLVADEIIEVKEGS